MQKSDAGFKYNQPILVDGIKFSNNMEQEVSARFVRKKDGMYVILYDGLLLRVKPEQVKPDPKNPF
jgi:phosphoglucomutase